MEMSYEEYIKRVNDALKEEAIREAVNSVKPLGKFIMADNSRWQPVHYAGYTLITPTGKNDCENAGSYSVLQDIKKELSGHIDYSKYVEAPDDALHMTVARLISGETFKSAMMGVCESEFLNYLKELFSKIAVPGVPRFEIKGISVFQQGVVAAEVSPVNEDDYVRLQNFRECIYSDKTVKAFGVERKRNFKGHITLFYIEKELDNIEKQKLSDAVIDINRRFFTKPMPFYIARAEVRRFNDFLSFCREKDWAVFDFG